MAFKGGSDDPPGEPGLQAAQDPDAEGRRRALHRPVHHRRRGSRRSTRCSTGADLLVIAAPHPEYRDSGDRQPGRRHVGHRRTGDAGMKPQVSVVIPVYKEGENIVACLERILREVTLPCEVLCVHDTPDDTTVAYVQKINQEDDRVRPVLNTYGPGPANAIRFGIDTAEAAGRRGDHGRRLRRPAPDRRPGPAGRPRRGGGRGVAVHARRPAGRRPAVQARAVALGRPHPALVRPGRHPRRDEQLQGVLDGVRARRSASTRGPASRSVSS